MGIALSVACAAWGSEVPAEDDQAWTIERFQWADEIGSRSHLELINEHGDLRTRDSADSRIEVVANLQKHAEDAWSPEVRLEETESGLRVVVVYASPEEGSPKTATEPIVRGRVDVSVLVPAGVDVTAITAEGLLELKGIDGDIDGRSSSGDVVLSTAGPVRVATVSGNIRALFKATDWPVPAELRSAGGEISVWLPPEADVTVVGETSGRITTDYTLEVERLPNGNHKRAVARIGGGGAELRLSSETGDLSILRSH